MSADRNMTFELVYRDKEGNEELQVFSVRYERAVFETPKDVAIAHAEKLADHPDFGGKGRLPIFRTFRCIQDRQLDDLGLRA